VNKTIHTLLLSIFLLISIISCTENPDTNWEVALKTDKSGKAVEGSKVKLIQAIKIGWGSKGKTRSIEHLSEPIWLGILNGQEVTAKLHPQLLGGTVDWDNLSANYSNTDVLSQEWRVVLTTKGSFDAIWYDRKGDSLVRHVPQQHPMTWFVSSNGVERNTPLFK